MVKKTTKQVIVLLVSLFLCAIIFFGYACANIMKVFAEEASNGNEVYLSDLKEYKTDMASGRPLIKNAVDDKGTKMQIKVEGAWYTFDKGLFTHTGTGSTAAVKVTYNLEALGCLGYNYFTAYVGLNKTATKGDGVRFNVGTSVNGTDYTWMEVSPKAIGPQAEAKFLIVNIKGAKWLQLWAHNNTGNAHDHAVWADAKLVKNLDSGEGVMSLEAYDEAIKEKLKNANFDDKQANLFADKELEKLVLQREFVSRVGQFALQRFTTQNDEEVNKANQAVLKWLLDDLDSLREFMLGGTPFGGSYYTSLTVLSQLYKSYKNDLKDTTKLNNKFMPDRTFGELCRTMMFSVALTHDKTIGSYLQGGYKVNQSEANRRYAIFKYMYQTERFVATRNADGSWKEETMTMFGSLKVEEMRWLMCNIIDDESLLWLNDYVQTRINAAGKVGNLYTPHSYVKYTDPNYNNPVFYAEENKEYFNDLFAVDYRGDNAAENGDDKKGTKIGLWDAEYTVPAGEGEEPYVISVSRSVEGVAKLQKVWMNFKNKFGTGSVCGGISKSGTNIRTSRGIPANVIGQPGHAAILYYKQDANGNGSWGIDNDVGGWLAATKGERHLLGWGNATWQRNSGGTVVYFHLAQTCLNDYDNLVKAEEYTWLAKVYEGDLNKQEKLYEKALSAQIMNLDAWYGLVTTYKANTAKTANDFSALAGRIGDTLWNHPVAMHCLFRLFTDETALSGLADPVVAALKDPVFTSQIKSIEIAALAKASTSGSTAAKSKVNYLLGIDQTSDIADFSFDGENAGCIVWAGDYSDGTFTWKYSVDGKKTWNEVIFEEGQSHAYQLPEKDLAQISPENDIYVYIVGASPDNAYKIDVAARPALPDTLYANDWENRVIGVDATYEWRYCTHTETETETGTEVNYTPSTGWVSYADASPDCSGDKAIEVRLKGTAKKPASESRIFTFTVDTDTPERKYISVNYLSMAGFSTESQDAKRPNYAVNAIDGNAKTYWHTDYAKSIKETTIDKDGSNTKKYEPAYLIIKLDVPRYISALEFAQRQYNASFSIFAKNVTVYVSETGEYGSWTVAATRENFEELDDLKAIHFAESVYGQYVKLEMTSLYETNKNDGVFTTVSMVNLYEDTTKTTSPKGEAMPSLSDVTPSRNEFADLGIIISEDEAFELAGAPTQDDPFIMDNPFAGEMGVPNKSNAGLWIALAVVGSVLIAAAVVVFVLCKRGIIKIGAKNNTNKDSKSNADTTAAPKASATATPKVSTTAAPKASTTAAPKASTTAAPKASTTAAPKASTTAAPKAGTTGPKASNTAAPKASTTAAPKAGTTGPKASTTTSAPKASTTAAPKAGTANSKSNAAKPKK